MFAPRCRWVTDRCRDGAPPLASVGPRRRSACVRVPEIADQISAALAALLAEREPAAEVEERERPLVGDRRADKGLRGRAELPPGARAARRVAQDRPGRERRARRGVRLREDDAWPVPRRSRAPNLGLDPRRRGRRRRRGNGFRGARASAEDGADRLPGPVLVARPEASGRESPCRGVTCKRLCARRNGRRGCASSCTRSACRSRMRGACPQPFPAASASGSPLRERWQSSHG